MPGSSARRGASVISMSPSTIELRGIAPIALAALIAAAPLCAATTAPVLRVDFPFPTADKPQAKLWHAEGAWWALLPRATGPSLWERGAAGWREHPAVTEKLRGLPGRADVWFDADGATSVTVADRMLAIVRLQRPSANAPWEAEALARIAAPVSDVIETATIARDSEGVWWVAAPIQGRVFAWSSADGRQWSEPFPVARGLHVDDLALVTRDGRGVVVIWSDQKSDVVAARTHRAGAKPAEWEKPVTIARGGDTADDHLSAATTPNGTLWLATKNSVDARAAPQLVLRVRAPDGVWRNFPYAPLLETEAPSRPIAIATPAPAPGAILLGHIVYDRKDGRRDRVVFGRVDLHRPEILIEPRVVIAPEAALDARVNDLTGPKAGFPADGPWIVLASDAEGRVYEADLRAEFGGR